MESNTVKRSSILNKTKRELEDEIMDAKDNIQAYERNIANLNDLIAEKQIIIDELILQRSLHGTLNFMEEQTLRNYEEDIQKKRDLIDSKIANIYYELGRITNREYDLREFNEKPTKSANTKKYGGSFKRKTKKGRKRTRKRRGKKNTVKRS